MQFFLKLLLLVGLFSSSVAGAPTTQIEGRLEFPGGSVKTFNITTRITLNNGEYTTFSRRDGSFVIYDVGPGIHQLDIDSKIYHFPQVKIQLLEDSIDAPKCLEYAFPGAQKRALKYPLVINPKGTYQYFEAKKGFSIFGLLRNPMVMMMLFSVGLMVAMPYMMEGLEPEEKARMREQMKNQQDPSAMFSQMWGDITGAEEEEAPKSKKERRRLK
eukprot:CAMPEP_0116130940 /NCGR_PEP_ID=MMETSP0329-20121206/8742_1 /TAXON_ID=697910 /ORGANISM="Pseudo-nitzschia arenysensis, Strain B593" /LENGTH=214 /DNA_ID=CAMNT_0003625341 /DNA_START=109 /DNA_END=753 /DNA_ORIENTATION=-